MDRRQAIPSSSPRGEVAELPVKTEAMKAKEHREELQARHFLLFLNRRLCRAQLTERGYEWRPYASCARPFAKT